MFRPHQNYIQHSNVAYKNFNFSISIRLVLLHKSTLHH